MTSATEPEGGSDLIVETLLPELAGKESKGRGVGGPIGVGGCMGRGGGADMIRGRRDRLCFGDWDFVLKRCASYVVCRLWC